MAYFSSDIAFTLDVIDFNLPMQGAFPSFITSPSRDVAATTLQFGAFQVVLDGFAQSAGGQLNMSAGDDVFWLMTNNLVLGSGSTFSSGTIAALGRDMGLDLAWQFLGVTVDAAEFSDAMQSVDRADDLALVAAMLTGSDHIALSDQNDSFAAGFGRDLITDAGGRNLLRGDGDGDLIMGGIGQDTILGGTGGDILIGGAAVDRLVGGNGADLLWMGAGADRASGGSGRDRFLFATGDGGAVITDFDVAEDRLVFFGAAPSLATLNLLQDGADAVIAHDGNTIRLLGVDAATLTLANLRGDGQSALTDAVTGFFAGFDYLD